MKFVIRNATVRDDQPSLCRSCTNHMYIRSSNNKEYRGCSRLSWRGPVQVPPRIVECSVYNNKAETPLHEMKQIAWILRTERSGRGIGFTPAKKLSEKEKEEYDDWDPEP